MYSMIIICIVACAAAKAVDKRQSDSNLVGQMCAAAKAVDKEPWKRVYILSQCAAAKAVDKTPVNT